MHASTPFLEVDHESISAPYRWAFRPDEPIEIRFGVLRALPCMATGVSVVAVGMADDAAPEILEAEEDEPDTVSDLSGYRMFRVVLPPAGREGGIAYRLGYRAMDGAWHWRADWRRLIVTNAPRLSADIERSYLGHVDGRPVYGPPPVVRATPSPADWRHRLFYSIVIDRFARGRADRRHAGLVPFRPEDARGSHGGTLDGIEDRLDYLADLGVGAIVLSPVYVNDAAGYHGYHPLHLLAVDPRLGGMEDLRSLVAAAHARGIAVLIDVIVNHLADCLDWVATDNGHEARFKYECGDLQVPLPYPEDLRHPAFFHSPGGDELVGTPLFGFLADWRTEHAYVREHLIRHLTYWIAEADIDGFRFDAVRHVDLPFWTHCVEEVGRYCRAIGKADFLMLGEHAGHTAAEVGPYSRDAAFTGMIDYPLHYCLREVFENGGTAAAVSRYLEHDAFAYRDSRWNLAFIDNQDTSRFLHNWGDRFGGLDRARHAHRAALTVLILGPAMPCVYYGTEQEFSGALGMHKTDDGQWVGHDAHVREDMFPNPDCQWIFGPINTPLHQPFDRTNPTFTAIRELARLRAERPAIRSGDRYTVIGDDPAVLAWIMWSKEGAGDLVLVAANLSPDGPQCHSIDLAAVATRLPDGARAILARKSGWSALVVDRAQFSSQPAGTLDLQLEGYGTLVLQPTGQAASEPPPKARAKGPVPKRSSPKSP